MIIGIDPGNKETAIVLIDDQNIPIISAKMSNATVCGWIYDAMINRINGASVEIGIECIASYGMAVGAEVFETAEWSGRIREYVDTWTESIFRVYRRDVKLNLCGSSKAKDGNVRQAIIDRYPRTGGGKTPQIGTKKEQGPLYGFAKDKWAALGVALTVADMRDKLTIWE